MGCALPAQCANVVGMNTPHTRRGLTVAVLTPLISGSAIYYHKGKYRPCPRELTVTGFRLHKPYVESLTAVEGRADMDEPRADRPEAFIQVRDTDLGRVLSVVMLTDEHENVMAGQQYVASNDSRWSRICGALLNKGGIFYGAVRLHNRVEQ